MDDDTLIEMKRIFKIMLEDEEFYELQAKVTSKTIHAMVNEGFTRAEAIACIVKK